MRKVKRYCARVDKGKVRTLNEDQAVILVNPTGDVLLVVADGLGGHAEGELASKIAVNTVIASFRDKQKFYTSRRAKKWLRKVFRYANTLIYEEAKNNEEYRGMGTTLTAALVLSRHLVIAHTGDSRAYQFNKDNQFIQVTNDHTLVGNMVRTGKITAEQGKIDSRRHILSHAIGTEKEPKVDLIIMPYNNETILLCTDGLYQRLNEKEIASILGTNDYVGQKVETLISLANQKGGDDNIGIALMETQP